MSPGEHDPCSLRGQAAWTDEYLADAALLQPDESAKLPHHPEVWTKEGRRLVKLLRVGPADGERPCVLGADGRVLDLSSLTADIDGAFLAAGGVERVRAALAEGRLPEAGPYERIGAPVARPGKI